MRTDRLILTWNRNCIADVGDVVDDIARTAPALRDAMNSRAHQLSLDRRPPRRRPPFDVETLSSFRDGVLGAAMALIEAEGNELTATFLPHTGIDIVLGSGLDGIVSVFQNVECASVNWDITGPPSTTTSSLAMPSEANTPVDWLTSTSNFQDTFAALEWYMGGYLRNDVRVGTNFLHAWNDNTVEAEPVRVAILGGGCTPSISDIRWFTVPQCDIYGTGKQGKDCIGWNFYEDSALLDSTHVTGDLHATLIASITNNQGFTATCNRCEAFCARITDNEELARVSALVTAQDWAYGHGGFKLLLHEHSFPSDSAAFRMAFDSLYANNHISVVPAGDNSCSINDEDCRSYPALYSQLYETVIAVGGSGRAGARAPASNWAPWLDAMAPSEALAGCATFSCGGFRVWSGTSGAAALVAAAVGHTWSLYPSYTATLWKSALVNSSSIANPEDASAGLLDVRALSKLVELETGGWQNGAGARLLAIFPLFGLLI